MPTKRWLPKNGTLDQYEFNLFYSQLVEKIAALESPFESMPYAANRQEAIRGLIDRNYQDPDNYILTFTNDEHAKMYDALLLAADKLHVLKALGPIEKVFKNVKEKLSDKGLSQEDLNSFHQVKRL